MEIAPHVAKQTIVPASVLAGLTRHPPPGVVRVSRSVPMGSSVITVRDCMDLRIVSDLPTPCSFAPAAGAAGNESSDVPLLQGRGVEKAYRGPQGGSRGAS